ncbi:MAG TPA: divalent-cation tolerance protein CutA [Ktedonobacteraceae bacterium]|nr:divalent-cation tolerance protein CutA [Ktedonobacteraceae bacterium]
MAEPIMVITNTSTQQEALQIASKAIERHLAAAVNISGPMTSVYRWQGKVETAEEWQCFIKTVQDRYSEVEQLIHEFHSYELPGIIALPLAAGSDKYLNWIEQETRDDESSTRIEPGTPSKEQLIQRLAEAHERLIEAATRAYKRGTTGAAWGPREVVAHIAGWEVMAAVRIPKLVAGIPPIQYVSKEQHDASDDNTNATIIAMIGNQSFEEVCHILREANQRDIQMLRELDEALFVPGNYVYGRIEAAIDHCNEHIQALEHN